MVLPTGHRGHSNLQAPSNTCGAIDNPITISQAAAGLWLIGVPVPGQGSPFINWSLRRYNLLDAIPAEGHGKLGNTLDRRRPVRSNVCRYMVRRGRGFDTGSRRVMACLTQKMHNAMGKLVQSRWSFLGGGRGSCRPSQCQCAAGLRFPAHTSKVQSRSS